MLTISHLRCEYLVNPLAVDGARPRLSWIVESDRRGARQAAWRVRVTSDAGDLWDSGRVEDDRTVHIEYEGIPLISRRVCHWQVQVWDEQGGTAVSGPASWTMGLLQDSDWQAHWIAADPEYLTRAAHALRSTRTEPGTPPWFRKVFKIDGSVRRATLYASARGLFDLHLNGRAVS